MRDRCLAVKQVVGMRGLLEHYGIELKRGRAPCPVHHGDNPEAFWPTKDDRGFVCSTNGCKGDVIAFVESQEGCSTKEAVEYLERYAGIDNSDVSAPRTSAKRRNTVLRPPAPQGDSLPVKKAERPVFECSAAKTWEYKDAEGNEVFSVKRFNEVNGGRRKQCRPYTNGRAGLSDDSRILFNMDLITSTPEDFIVLVEGEKCAEAVTEAGFIGTTNPMGSGQWKPEFGYGEALRGRDVLVIPDADEESEKWLKAIKEDLCGKVSSLQIGSIPDEFIKNNPQFKGHDVADVSEVNGKTCLTELIVNLKMDSVIMPYGVEPGLIVTPNDALAELAEMHQSGDFEKIKFNKWVTGLNVTAYASDLVVVMAQTGTGKTRILHNIPFHITDLNYMMFDLELSRGILGLRYASMATGISTKQILKSIKQGRVPVMPDISHIHLDNTGNIDMDYIKDRVNLVEDIIQKRIDVIGIDYIGLMKKKGFNSRYGALSEHVETFKGYLNESRRTGLISTQCGRSSDKEEGYFQCPSMFAAKDSGSIENSAQLVLRAWRTSPEDRRRIGLNVGKWSHDEPPANDFNLIADGLLITGESEYENRQGNTRDLF